MSDSKPNSFPADALPRKWRWLIYLAGGLLLLVVLYGLGRLGHVVLGSFYTGERLDTQINDETGEITEKIKINDYFLVNGNVSMPLPYGLKIYLGVRNLTDYVDKIWGPMPGREFYSGLTYKF